MWLQQSIRAFLCLKDFCLISQRGGKVAINEVNQNEWREDSKETDILEKKLFSIKIIRGQSYEKFCDEKDMDLPLISHLIAVYS